VSFTRFGSAVLLEVTTELKRELRLLGTANRMNPVTTNLQVCQHRVKSFENQPPRVSVRFYVTEPGANALRLIIDVSVCRLQTPIYMTIYLIVVVPASARRDSGSSKTSAPARL
jgi:hypothetical protein